MADERIKVVVEGNAADLEAALAGAIAAIGGFEKKVDSSTKTLDHHDKQVNRNIGSFGRMSQATVKLNQSFSAMRNIIGLIKFPALIAAAGAAAQAIGTLAAAAVSLGSAMGPAAVGAATAYAGAMMGLGQGMAVVKLATKDLSQALAGNQEALKRLTPEARKFLGVLKSYKPEVDAIQRSVQKGIFPGMTAGLKAASPAFAVVRKELGATAKVMGGLAASAGRLVGQMARSGDLGKIMAGNTHTVKALGGAMLSLVSAFRHVMVAAQPFLKWMTDGVAHWAKWVDSTMAAKRANGQLATTFQHARASISRLVSIGGNLIKTLLGVGKAARPAGMELLKSLDKTTERWSKWTNSLKGQNALKKYFDGQVGPAREMGRLVEDLGRSFAKLTMGKQSEQLIHAVRTQLLPAFTELIGSTTKALGPSLIKTLTEVAKLFTTIAGSSGPLVGAIKLLGSAAGALNGLLNAIPGLKSVIVFLLGAGGLYHAFGLAATLSGTKSLIKMVGDLKGAFARLAETRAGGAVVEAIMGPIRKLGSLVLAPIQAAGRRLLLLGGYGITAGRNAARAILVRISGLASALLAPLRTIAARIITTLTGAGATAGAGARDAANTRIGQIRPPGPTGKFARIFGAFGRVVGAALGLAAAAEITRALNDALDLGDATPSDTGGNKKVSSLLPFHLPKIGGINLDEIFRTGRRGGLMFAQGGMVPAMVSPGELVIHGSQAAMVPGTPVAADSVAAMLPVGSAVITGHGQQMLAQGASLGQTLAHQLPHFRDGGTAYPKAVTHRGYASWYGGPNDHSDLNPITAYGYSHSHPGISLREALFNRALDGPALSRHAFYRVVSPQRRVAILPLIDKGPGIAHRGLDVGAGALRMFGFNESNFPTDKGLWRWTGPYYSRALARGGGGGGPALRAASTKTIRQKVAAPHRAAMSRGALNLWMARGSSAIDDAWGQEPTLDRAGRPVFSRLARATRVALNALSAPSAQDRPSWKSVTVPSWKRTPRPTRKGAKGGKAPRAWRGKSKAGLHSAIINLAELTMGANPALSVSSTTGGQHSATSMHYRGRAVDLVGGNLNMEARWVWQNIHRQLNEGIHNPNLSVQSGRAVPPSYWGSDVWANHVSHIHLAARRGGILGYKAGGIIPKIWKAASSFFPKTRPDSFSGVRAMPTTWVRRFGDVYGSSMDGIAGQMIPFEDGSKRVEIDQTVGNSLRGSARARAEGIETLIHEWAHAYQRPGVRRIAWQREGGAEAFTRAILPSVLARLGIHVRPSFWAYARETARVRRDRSQGWIMRGQFTGVPKFVGGGLTGRLAPGGTAVAPTENFGGYNAAPVQAAANGVLDSLLHLSASAPQRQRTNYLNRFYGYIHRLRLADNYGLYTRLVRGIASLNRGGTSGQQRAAMKSWQSALMTLKAEMANKVKFSMDQSTAWIGALGERDFANELWRQNIDPSTVVTDPETKKQWTLADKSEYEAKKAGIAQWAGTRAWLVGLDSWAQKYGLGTVSSSVQATARAGRAAVNGWIADVNRIHGSQVVPSQDQDDPAADAAADRQAQLNTALAEQNRILLAQLRLGEGQFKVFQRFQPLLAGRLVGSFASGGWIPRTGLAMVHEGEYVIPRSPTPQAMPLTSQGSRSAQVHITLDGDAAALVSRVRAEIDGRAAQVVSEQLGRRVRSLR